MQTPPRHCKSYCFDGYHQDLLSIQQPCEKENLHMEKSGHGVCVWTYHIHHLMPVIPEIHRSRSSGPHSMIKSSNWWPTAFHWNGPPPDMIKPGRTQLSNLKKKAFTNLDLVRETKSTDPAWKQMKQDTRVDFIMYAYGCPGSCHWPQPKTILHQRKMIEHSHTNRQYFYK